MTGDKLIEEMAELTHAILKARRFGMDNWNPDTGRLNSQQIRDELYDVESALALYRAEVDMT